MDMIFHLLLMTMAALGTPPAGGDVETLRVGSSAPGFNLPGVDGRNWNLQDFSDSKILVVVFTCNHCPTAQYYEERLRRIATEYKNSGVAVVAIMPNDPKAVRLDELGWSDLGDSFPEMKIRARDHAFNFPYLYDGDSEQVSRAYGPIATPHVFVFDSTRSLRYVGAIDNSQRIAHVTRDYLRDAIDAVLAGRTPPVTETKAVGCSIKWADKKGLTREYLERLNAEPVSLSIADTAVMRELRENGSGKFRLVNFWATWCPPCIVEFEDIVTVNRMYRHRDFELVTVSIDDTDKRSAVIDFLKERHASNRNLILDSGDRERLMAAFDPKWQGAVPYTVIIDPEGEVLYRETGSVDILAVKRLLQREMNSRKPW